MAGEHSAWCWHTVALYQSPAHWGLQHMQSKELSLGLRIHLNLFIIPTGWRAGEGGRAGEGREILPWGEDPGSPANQKSLITFNSPRECLSGLSYLLWGKKSSSGHFNLTRIIEQGKYNSPKPLSTLQLDLPSPAREASSSHR